MYQEETYVVPLQKVYFDVIDKNGGDFISGNLVVWNDTKGGYIGDNISLDTNMESFTWIARPSYDVSVQYQNEYYDMTSNYVNDTIVNPNGNTTSIIDSFDDTDMIALGGDDYQFIFNYEVDSLLNWIDIDISGVTDYIDTIEVQLVYDLGGDTVYYEDISGTSTTSWANDISLWSDSNGIMKIDSLRSNKVRVIVTGHNSSANTGTINVDLFYQAVETVEVPFSEVQLEFIDEQDDPAVGFLIEIYETVADIGTQDVLVSLTTNEFGEAFDLDDNPFYYFDN